MNHKTPKQTITEDTTRANGNSATDSTPGLPTATPVAAIPDASANNPIPATRQPRSSKRNGTTTVTDSVKTEPRSLTEAQKKELAAYEQTIRQYSQDQAGNFHELALASHMIQRDKLYREYPTQAAYFKAKFNFSRSHSLRLAKMGQLLDRVSPTGDKVRMFASDAHLRPLLRLTDDQQDAAISKAESWAKMAKLVSIPAKLLAAARVFLNPPTEHVPKESAQTKLVAKFHEAIGNAKAMLPTTIDTAVTRAFDYLKKKAKEFGEELRRTTGIDWTEKTWNVVHGCTRASCGCDECYAAKQTATRLADLYPGLAKKNTTAAGTITYAFTGKIQLSPEDLAEPLLDHVPKMIFVNSMSDIFHRDVPEEFIEDVFTVMEKAHWHTFQVLTKRPERMAAFTQKRYADKVPPKNIWLGTSTEDQSAYNERITHLRQTKAAVRWLSVEPLLGPIQFDSTDGINWVVVGGESGPNARPMKKEWAVSIRDACKTAKIPFFFKQWGAFNEEGVKQREPAGPSKLDGKIHHEYPTH